MLESYYMNDMVGNMIMMKRGILKMIVHVEDVLEGIKEMMVHVCVSVY